MNNTAFVTRWRLFKLEKPEPHIQISFETPDGLMVKNLYLKHPRRPKTIQFLISINGQGSFRTLEDIEDIIKHANFKPISVDWRFDRFGDKELVKVNQR
jgi:hypothetical protein